MGVWPDGGCFNDDGISEVPVRWKGEGEENVMFCFLGCLVFEVLYKVAALFAARVCNTLVKVRANLLLFGAKADRVNVDTENEAVRRMMFPLSLTGEAKTWLDELNEGTIETWDEFQTAFISRFFPPALFDRLLGEIRAFSLHENESLTDDWLRMKEMLRNCHGHNLSKCNMFKIFYHGLYEITQEVLNAAAGGNFLYKTPNQAYQLLEDKVLLKLDWAKNQKTKSSLKKTVALADEGSSNSDTDKI
ncbi:reverse transcriptase domain-containing protein, partial [Tanacetum coccineum]